MTVLTEQTENADTLSIAAKQKLQKYQIKKADGLEQENIRLKERLFKTEEQVDWMEHEIKILRERNTELQRLMANDFISDNGEDIMFSDHHTLEAYENEERFLFQDLKRKLHELRERFKNNSAELCSHCMGEMIEV